MEKKKKRQRANKRTANGGTCRALTSWTGPSPVNPAPRQVPKSRLRMTVSSLSDLTGRFWQRWRARRGNSSECEGQEGKERRGGGERERDLNSRTPLRKLFSFHESLSGVIIVLEKRESETLSTDSSPLCGLHGGWAAVPWERRMEFKFCNYRNRKGEGGRGRGD